MSKTYPGINPGFTFEHFSYEEEQIIKKLGKEQYVTNSGNILRLSKKSVYKYFLFKPASYFAEMFNFDREILVLFSNYENFEPRTLDAIDIAMNQYPFLRIDSICAVLVSRDENIENRINELVINNPETRTIIPITYNEFINYKDDYFLRNKFKKFLFSRNLFDFTGPLKKDLYFYGRNELLNDILSKHKSGENCGLFGLRRTGKTSVAYGIKRLLEKDNRHAAIIDCQNTSINQRRWNYAISYIIEELCDQNNIKIDSFNEKNYTPQDAARCFEKDLKQIVKKLKSNVMIIFDEIENISFNTSPVAHWRDDIDFVFFWQTLRSVYQKLNCFTFTIIGTNPTAIENSTIKKKDNPLFNQIPIQYIPGFTIQQTRDMTKRLGRIMGLKFEESIYTKLTESFGGHPFLIRQVCSLIHKKNQSERPIIVDKVTYKQIEEEFERNSDNYIKMILDVLLEYYPDEYEMLKSLALENYDEFKNYANEFPECVRHLIGYGIIAYVNNNYYFHIYAVYSYINKKERYNRTLATKEDKLSEISERRNRIEHNLKNIIRQQLLATHGAKKAKQKVLEQLRKKDQDKAYPLSYNEIFKSKKVNIYFYDLKNIISQNWSVFQNIFFDDKDKVETSLSTINQYRNDAHSKDLTDDEMTYFRLCAKHIEHAINEFIS